MDSKSKRIFERFTDATAALLDCDDAPDGVHKALGEMLDYFGNELNGNDVLDTGFHAHRVMAKVFGLDEVEEEPAKDAPERSEDEVDEDRAARELAQAFSTITEYRNYLPDRFYRNVDDAISDFFAQADWTNDPALILEVGPLILRAAMARIAAKETY